MNKDRIMYNDDYLHGDDYLDEPMDPGERALEKRKHALRALNEGGVFIGLTAYTTKPLREQLDCFLLKPPFSQMFLSEREIHHLLEHGYIPGKDIILNVDSFLIDEPSIDGIRPPLIVEYFGYKHEWSDPSEL